MKKKENLEIKMAPEELTPEDLEKVDGGLRFGDEIMRIETREIKDDSKKK